MKKYHDAISGKKYDISHLEKHLVEYIQNATKKDPERRFRVEISYSNHCYTKANADGTRLFDKERYELSKLLPLIISELMNRECHHTGRTNFVTFDVGATRSYEVYFEVFRKNGLNLRVQSAYLRDESRMGNRPVRSRIRFSTILYNVQNNKPIHPPKQKR